jgi:hypothetical protein
MACQSFPDCHSEKQFSLVIVLALESFVNAGRGEYKWRSGNLSRRHSEALETAKRAHCLEEPLLFSRIGALNAIR